jgi:hypothetical protein
MPKDDASWHGSDQHGITPAAIAGAQPRSPARTRARGPALRSARLTAVAVAVQGGGQRSQNVLPGALQEQHGGGPREGEVQAGVLQGDEAQVAPCVPPRLLSRAPGAAHPLDLPGSAGRAWVAWPPSHAAAPGVGRTG